MVLIWEVVETLGGGSTLEKGGHWGLSPEDILDIIPT